MIVLSRNSICHLCCKKCILTLKRQLGYLFPSPHRISIIAPNCKVDWEHFALHVLVNSVYGPGFMKSAIVIALEVSV